ncbi:cytokine receptor common subunit gamma-like isoform X2 [Labeo rohita]|uniref:cytokine receptor common subunit gamma-like isoform X2 n=1 Tax=Labeo rohita TaxID=84645 RepID=UPI0021E1D9DE|nr:cytokine receptor common subunit gamma-like isoform X2 [Labeo rohita]
MISSAEVAIPYLLLRSCEELLQINCLIINLDYVNCTWSEQKHNYSFKSKFTHNELLDCPKYLRNDSVNVGCIFPYKRPQRFTTLIIWLYSDDGSLVTMQEHNLMPNVKLYPPFNLTVVEKKDSELWLYWSMPTNISCIESHVLYRTDDNAWQITTTGFSTTIFLPFHLKKRYEFQVRARIASGCGQSMFWSDWSEPVYWGSLKTNNSTGVSGVRQMQ